MSSPPSNETRREPMTLVLVVACLVLSGLVVVLAWQNWSMKRQLSSASHRPDLPAEALRPGDRLEPFEVLDASGAPVRIEFGEASPNTLLLVFSSTCPACERNMPTWNELLTQPLPKDWRVVAIQTDDGTHATPLPFTVYGVDRAHPAPLDRVPFVPATVVVAPTGEVLSSWFGILSDDDRAALEQKLAPLIGTASRTGVSVPV